MIIVTVLMAAGFGGGQKNAGLHGGRKGAEHVET